MYTQQQGEYLALSALMVDGDKKHGSLLMENKYGQRGIVSVEKLNDLNVLAYYECREPEPNAPTAADDGNSLEEMSLSIGDKIRAHSYYQDKNWIWVEKRDCGFDLETGSKISEAGLVPCNHLENFMTFSDFLKLAFKQEAGVDLV